MQELIWLIEPLRVWLSGGSWADGVHTDGFMRLATLVAVAVPGTIIAFGIGMTEWHETPLGAWFGARAPDPDEPSWTDRARDLDKDGQPDI
jgi:hypothetical protein